MFLNKLCTASYPANKERGLYDRFIYTMSYTLSHRTESGRATPAPKIPFFAKTLYNNEFYLFYNFAGYRIEDIEIV